MAKPFKFRYVNEIAGTFAGVVVVILIVGLVLAGRAQKWFHRVSTFTIQLPREGSHGLKDGAEVTMMGTTVGAVDQINPPNEFTGQMTMVIHVDPEFAKFICDGKGNDSDGHPATPSLVVIKEPPIAITPTTIDISRGSGTEVPPNLKTVTLVAESGSAAGDEITKTVGDVREKMIPAAEKLLKEYTQLASDLRSSEGPVQQTFAHIEVLTKSLERTDSVLGRLTTDKEMANKLAVAIEKLSSSAADLKVMLANLQETTAELPKIAKSASAQVDKLPEMVDKTSAVMSEAEKTLKDLQQTTAHLPAVIESLQRTVDSLPDVMVHTQQTLLETEKLIRGMQALPFIRDHVEHGGETNVALEPADVGGPR